MENAQIMQVQVRGNCLSPVGATDFQQIFYATRDHFDLLPEVRSETGQETCIDPGPDEDDNTRAFSKGGNA